MPVLAQTAQTGPSAAAQPQPSPKFSIRGFKIMGENPLSASETTEVLAAFLRTDADIDSLQKATAALEARLRERGYGLHRVALPPQEISDTVQLEIVKFAINQIFIERQNDAAPPMPVDAKDARYSDANIMRSVPELRAGATPNFRQLAVQTAIANESAAKQITVALKESDQPDKIDATLKVRESKPWWASLNASNSGSPSSGNDRVTLSAAHANLWNADHQASLSITTSAERTRDVQQYGLNYRMPLYELGGVVGVVLTKSSVVGNFGTFTSTGAGQTWGVNYVHHLKPIAGYRGFVNLGLDNKRFDITQINGFPSPGQMQRRSQPISVGYNARSDSDASNFSYSVDLAANLSGASGNDLVSYQSEDPRVATTRFKIVRASMSYLAPLFERKWTLGVRSQLQWTPTALIAGEQFGIGGSGSVRGTSERPISGDKGASISAELGSPELFSGMRAVGFVDLGYLTNVTSNGATKLGNDRLASAGLGLRYFHPVGLSITMDFGRITTGSKVPLTINSASPQRGDEKMHLNASMRF